MGKQTDMRITEMAAGKSFKTMCGQCGQQYRARPCGVGHTAIKAALMIRAKNRRKRWAS